MGVEKNLPSVVATRISADDGTQIQLGGISAFLSAVLGEPLVAWLNAHTHTCPTGTSSTPVLPVDSAAVLSPKVKLT